MKPEIISLKDIFSSFSKQWSPKIIAQMNDYHFKIAKIQGEFVWHSHPETDEMFYVVQGRMTIHLRGGDLELEEGEMCVIPQGMEHKPAAAGECHILMVEPAGTLNTGDSRGERTVEEAEWI